MKTNIVPVAVFPGTANVLEIRAVSFGPPPQYYYELQEIQFDEQFNPTLSMLKNSNVAMTEAQWQAWPAGLGEDGDTQYQLDCISANLGVTRA